MDWKDRLTSEKSLFDVYKKAKHVASSRSNKIVSFSIFLILFFIFSANIYTNLSIISYSSLILTIRKVAEIGFLFNISILGFLVAGFAIFSSITKPDVFILLAKLNHTKLGISRLQFIFFNFLFVFIHFIAFLSFCIFINIFLFSGGPFSSAIRLIAAADSHYIIFGSSIALSILVSWLSFLIMLLKSFIWNMYQAVLVTIVTEAEMREQEEKRHARSGQLRIAR